MTNIRENWNGTTLGSVFNHRKEQGHNEEELLSVTGSKGVVRRDSLERRDTSNKDKSKYLLVGKGDIVYNTMRMWQGVSGVSSYRGIVSPAYTVCSPTEKIDSRFAGYFLKDPAMVSLFKKRSQGLVSDTWNLKYEMFAQICCDLPPLPDQRKIAEILSGIDNLRNQLTLKIQSLYFLRKALFQKISSISFDSEKVKFEEIIEEIRSGWSPTCLPRQRVGNSPGVLKTSAITWDGYKPSKNKAVPKSMKVKNQALVQEQDILCTRKGPMERVGVVCYVEKTPVNLMLPDTAFRIRISNHLNAKFIALVLATDAVQNVWHKKKIGLAEAQVNINHGIIKETEIPIPTSQIQDEIVEQISSNMTLINNLKNQVESLTQLKRGLSSDLLSGRKRVSI